MQKNVEPRIYRLKNKFHRNPTNTEVSREMLNQDKLRVLNEKQISSAY